MYYSITTVKKIKRKRKKKTRQKPPIYTKLRSRESRDTILITAATVD